VFFSRPYLKIALNDGFISFKLLRPCGGTSCTNPNSCNEFINSLKSEIPPMVFELVIFVQPKCLEGTELMNTFKNDVMGE